MININSISIQYGGRYLFDNVSFSITEKDRLGLVGKNGAGKSTLMKLLIDEIRPSEGNISMDNKTTLGYLPQTLKMESDLSVFKEASKAFDKINQLKGEIDELTEYISTTTDYTSKTYTKKLTRLGEAQDQLHIMGASNIRETVEKTLKGLGFVNGDFDRKLSTFSGGWRMRVELAKILLSRPDFVLLDEPTNHLDIESIMWLENFLANYHGGVILISHDRAFLDQVTNRTIELVNGNAYDYRTSYSKFMDLRAARREKQAKEAVKQAKEIENTKMLIEKFRAKKNKAKFAQTLIRKLEKTEIIEVEDAENSAINFRFPPSPRSGKIVAHADRMSKSYGDHLVLKNVDFELERGEKIAFVGKNGEGKSTFAKVIVGEESYNGVFELGHNVKIGYFEQHQAENLEGKKTVLQTIEDAATGEWRTKVRSLLGAFLFRGEDVDKKVSVLSGGEKSRLALARLLLEPVNLLILDEPTNHLDMQAKEILKNALRLYDGSMIVVSHDREFLKELTDKVYEFRGKRLHQHIGDVYNFLNSRALNTLDELNLGYQAEKAAAAAVAAGNKKPELSKQERIALREKTRELDKAIKRLNNKVSKAERQIADAEKEIADFELVMNNPDFYSANPDPTKVMNNYAAAKKKLEEIMEQWENHTMQLEEYQEERAKFED